MQDSAGPVRTQPIGSSNRVLVVLAILVAGLIALAAFKPWDTRLAGSGGADGDGPLAGVGAEADAKPAPNLTSPSVDPSLELVARRKQCQNPDAWRIVTMERIGPRHTRTLLPVTPVAAVGPSDPAIVARAFHAAELYAIGYCVPVADGRDVAATEARLTLWQRLPDGQPVVLHNLVVLDPALAATGEVYLGPSGGLGTAGWPSATYVFDVPGAGPGGAVGWFSLDFSANGPVALAP